MNDPAPASPTLNACILDLHAALKPLRGLLDIGVVLERARDAEQIIADKENTCALLEATADKMRQMTIDAQAAAAVIAAESDALVKEAARVLAEAKTQAAEIVELAQAQGERHLAAAHARCLDKQTAAHDLDAEIARAKASLDEIAASVAERQTALDAALATIAKAEAIRAVMG